MAEVTIRDLAGFGLPLVAQDDPSFPALAAGIESRQRPERVQSPDKDRAAVLLNNTGRAIVCVEWFWRYSGPEGKPRISRFLNLTSSAQWDVLSGRSKVWRDAGTFILPGSKRLLTEHGMFGDNLDVLTPEEMHRGQGYGGGWGGARFRSDEELQAAAIELVLDLVILDDGLCVGPDESGLYGALTEALDAQRAAAREAAAALHGGASLGQVFEIIRPLARDRPPERERAGKRIHFAPIRPAFGREAVHRLINADPAELLAFFEKAAEPSALELRRP